MSSFFLAKNFQSLRTAFGKFDLMALREHDGQDVSIQLDIIHNQNCIFSLTHFFLSFPANKTALGRMRPRQIPLFESLPKVSMTYASFLRKENGIFGQVIQLIKS